MIVARPSRNVPPLLARATPSAPSASPPKTRHYMALIPTNWGVCGALWKTTECRGDACPNGFVEKSEPALLCRIITPGLPVSALRAQLAAGCAWCDEVIGDREGNFHPEVVPEWFPDLVKFLRAYYTDAVCGEVGSDFANSWNFWRVRLDWSQLTPFQREVLEATAAIPSGQKLTYGGLAKRIGRPGSSRAVGAALGSNPWPVLIPCHRVVGANGKMTGFSAPGGVETKRRMLEKEAGLRGLFGGVRG